MRKTSSFLASALMLALSTFVQPVFAQGSLTPPGAPAPLFKTLDQVEPRVPLSVIPTNLTQSGSYYLTTNLTQTILGNGITIATNDITIDLNGFALIGTNGVAVGIAFGGSARTNIWIRNGTIRNWQHGLQLTGGGDARVEQVRIIANSSNGLHSTASAVVADCHISANGGHGILLTSGPNIIRGCLIHKNAGDGIIVTSGPSTIVGNVCAGFSSAPGPTNAAIRVSIGQNNRVDGNELRTYTSGVIVSSQFNWIVRNFVHDCATNFLIAANNFVGPTNNQFNGFVITNHPWANFSDD